MLPRAFYDRPAEAVAPDLLGTILCHDTGAQVLRGRVVETEAYAGAEDLACHAAKGRTRRTEVMFGPPGHAYVYLIYGMYHMLNVVTHAAGEPQAVLIRALEPLGALADQGRTDGPGRLTRATGITVQARNGNDLCAAAPERRLWFEAGDRPERVAVGPRIGIDYAGSWVHAPLRFVDAASTCLSRPAP